MILSSDNFFFLFFPFSDDKHVYFRSCKFEPGSRAVDRPSKRLIIYRTDGVQGRTMH